MSSLLTVVIPSSEDRWLAQTITDLFEKAAGPLQVIACLNGYTPTRALPHRPGLTYLHETRASMRGALNAARAHVRGQWVGKCDEHVMFSEGFDEIIKRDCPDNCLMVPRRHSLNVGTEEDPKWEVENNPKGPRDYHLLSCPIWSIREKSDYSMHGLEWKRRTDARLHGHDIDPTMSWQGSFYFMSRKHYEWLGPLDETYLGGFAAEPQELGLKTQLGGGEVLVNKHCWGAHLHKGKQWQRGYRPNKAEISRGHEYNAWYWMTGQWAGAVRSLESLVAQFWPVPGWPVDILGNWPKYAPKGATLDELKARARGADVVLNV